jgi:surface polysaccharide O-acyltransferase-like enzyme
MLTENKKYVLWLDLIRALSIFLVIVIHVSSPLYNHGENMIDWMAGNIYNSIARVSVPLLFMVSGYLLLNRQEDIRSFYVNRVRKVVLPLLVWSVIYLVWDNNGYPDFTFINAIKAIIYAILNGPAYYHFWFVYSLLAIYLFVPVLRIFVHAADETAIRYFALIWFVFGPLLDFVEQRFLGFKVSIDLGFFTEFIGYFYLGYVIGRFNFSRRSSMLVGLIYVLLTVYTIYATTVISIRIGEYFDFLLFYLRLNIVVMTVCAFICLKSLGEALEARWSQSAIRSIRVLSSASFGIYLIHAMMLWMIRKGTFGFQLTALSLSPFVMIPLLALLVFCISFVIIRILQQIPYLRAIVPS